MKKIITVLSFLILVSSSLLAQTITFESLEINYGEIVKGADGVRVFKFTNTGTAPLVISNATSSCGCTVPSYPIEPIMPGASNTITVRYDTNRVGAFTKYVTLTTNDESNYNVRLKLSGSVRESSGQ